MRTSHRRGVRSFLTPAVTLAGMLTILCATGCAGSASNGWAQRSPVIAPEKRPPALTMFSNGGKVVEDDLH